MTAKGIHYTLLWIGAGESAALILLILGVNAISAATSAYSIKSWTLSASTIFRRLSL